MTSSATNFSMGAGAPFSNTSEGCSCTDGTTRSNPTLPEELLKEVGAVMLKYLPQMLAFGVTVAIAVWGIPRFRGRLTTTQQRTAGRFLFLGFLYVLSASCVLDAFMSRWGFRGDSPKSGFAAVVSFEAERPFAYRVLSPLLIRAVVDAVPTSWTERHEEFLLTKSALLRYRQPNESWNVAKSLGWHVAYAFQFLFVIGGLVAARAFLREAVPNLPAAFVDFAPPIGALFLMLTFIHGGYMYDFPELYFLLTGAVLISKKRWLPYCLIFVLAILNKETGVFLAVYFAAFQWDVLPRTRLLFLALMQMGLGAVLIAAVRYFFRGSPGAPIDNWIIQHALTWTNPLSYMKFFDFVAPYIWIPRATNIITLALLSCLVVAAWPVLSGRIRRLAVVISVINTGLVLTGGFPDEVRNFSLLFPPLFAIGALGVHQFYCASAESAARVNRPPQDTV